MQVLGQRRRQRQDVGGQLAHLLGHLQLRHAVADHRLVDVEVERAAPRRRRSGASTARRREPAAGRRPAESRRRAPARSGAALRRRAASSIRSRSVGVPRMTRMRSISSGSRPVSRATSSTVTCSSGSANSSSAKPKAEASLAARLASGPRASDPARACARPPAPGPPPPASSGRVRPAPPSPRPSASACWPRRRSGERPRSGICALRLPSAKQFRASGGRRANTDTASLTEWKDAAADAATPPTDRPDRRPMPSSSATPAGRSCWPRSCSSNRR